MSESKTTGFDPAVPGGNSTGWTVGDTESHEYPPVTIEQNSICVQSDDRIRSRILPVQFSFYWNGTMYHP